jgi:hypothetical protein
MIFVTKEGESPKTGIHFYPLNDIASFGFRIVRATNRLHIQRYDAGVE